MREAGRLGYALVDRGTRGGPAGAIAVPIRGAGDAVTAAINVSAHASRVSMAAMRGTAARAACDSRPHRGGPEVTGLGRSSRSAQASGARPARDARPRPARARASACPDMCVLGLRGIHLRSSRRAHSGRSEGRSFGQFWAVDTTPCPLCFYIAHSRTPSEHLAGPVP